MSKFGESEYYKPTNKPGVRQKVVVAKWDKSFQSLMRDYEAGLLRHALTQQKGVLAYAARSCGLNRTTFLEKCKKLGVDYRAHRVKTS